MQLTRNVTRVASITTTTAVKKLRSQVLCNHIYSNRKTLWTAATCSDPDLSTALSRCLPTANKANTTASLSNAQGQKDSITIILASRSYPGLICSRYLQNSRTMSLNHPSFSAQSSIEFLQKSGHGVSTLTLTPDPPVLPTNSLDPTDPLIISCQPFYRVWSRISSEKIERKIRGKWARPQDIEERSLDTADPDIFMISDLEVHQFLEALDTANPDVINWAFWQAQPRLLLGNLVRNAATVTATSRTSISYPSMAPLGPAMRITSLMPLDYYWIDYKPHINQGQGVLFTNGEITNANQGQHIDIDMQKATVYKITGGILPKEIWLLFFQIFYIRSKQHIEEQSQSPEQNQKNTDNTFISNLFGASSENGFIVGQPNSHTWVCAVTDSVLTFLK
ncbi:hypothetical protein BCR41DRAFT_356744 [Lobosporangium transversale]|uniref:Uncharacterized protein n=1 Tax=Lobosporangium transversale TaxID=64571 RepID=A0A1Y2GJN6_9FUNG|nr:hypothetical protein BCR41DRAFT_356744 [Lobosporangium transversale]ORZ11678.1 hypothetical protein BCR41DRAFT_356744 [Lobosporangium transversale]|eukprot:XP_021879775.1 hypothetical protein BCR41DRAFT_356744 [Lobosporangium transversale]